MITTEAVKVPITPQGGVMWQAYDVAGGRLYVPVSDSLPDDPLVTIRDYLSQPLAYETIGNGKQGVVKDVAGYALKHFIKPQKRFSEDTHKNGKLPDVRATVALAEGLKALSPIPDSLFDFRGVELYASFVPESCDAGDDSNGIVWLMERLHPTREFDHYHPDFPLRSVRLEFCRGALRLMGLDPRHVYLDDDPTNTVITDEPDKQKRGTLVKIDVGANPGKLNV